MGKALVWLTHIPISPSIIGMIILFSLLSIGLFPTAWVKDGSAFLVKHMTLFFVPIGVGLMEHFNIIQEQAAALLAGTIGSSLIIFIVIGKLNNFLANRYEQKSMKKEIKE